MPRTLLISVVIAFASWRNPATADGVPVATLTLPAQLVEGTLPLNNAVLSVDPAPATALTMSINVDPADELSIPGSVTVPAGQTQAVFTVQAVNDTRIDGNVLVTVTASAAGISPASAHTTTIDNETRALSLTIPPFTILEGTTTSASVKIPGTLTVPLIVNLASGDEAVATVPEEVTIPANATSAVFIITAVDNHLRDGTRTVTIMASADSFSEASGSIMIRDDEIAGYRFTNVPDIVDVSSPVNITVKAVDVNGSGMVGVTATVNLTVVMPDGSTAPLTPATVVLTGYGWSGTVTLPPVEAGLLRLRATDDNANTGDSIAFDIMRRVPLKTADLVWDALRNRIYASVPANAGGAYANQVVSIDPDTLQIVGNVPVGQDPKRLVLTIAGEALYVALDANGTIAKIDPDTMAIASTFVLGSQPDWGGGPYYAEDMCTVPGQPDVLVISRYSKTVSITNTAVYDHGVMRPQVIALANRIESSADPTLFFSYNNKDSGFDFRQLRVGANGLTQIAASSSLIGGFYTDIRSEGDKVFTNTGFEVDGRNMQRLGTFSLINSSSFCPDVSRNRIYFVDARSSYDAAQDKICAFDPTTFALTRRLTLPAPIWPKSFIRWGTNGLAIGRGDADSILLINSSRLVPNDPPADLAITVQAAPDPAWMGGQLVYTISVVNHGPNAAYDVALIATLSNSQTVQQISASKGTASVNSRTVNLSVDNLLVGESATLSVTALPSSAGKLVCQASASSVAFDPDVTNNVAIKFISAGFQAAADSVNLLRLGANNLIYDPTRNLLWATIRNSFPPYPPSLEIFPDDSLVAIDPATGLTSAPIPINELTVERSMAIAPNGRYLYVGLYNSSEILRVDLTTAPPTLVRVPLGRNPSGEQMCAQDIEVLDGDGTSFLMTGTYDHDAVVFDGSVPRPNRTGRYTVSRIERTTTPNNFVGYDNYTFPNATYALKKLSVTPAGVAVTQSDSTLFHSYYAELRSSGNLLLSNTGALVDIGAFTLNENLGLGGAPCLDSDNGRAYIVNGYDIHGFDVSTGNAIGLLTFPVWLGDNASMPLCVRWGLDGFAVTEVYDHMYIARWSSVIPADRDQNNDLISDAWEATYFGTLNVNASADADGDGIANAFEYFFGTSPLQGNANPVQIAITTDNGATIIHLVFPRRVGLAAQAYGYETSVDLQQWSPAPGVTETILSSQTVGGVQLQTIDAAIPSPEPANGFARLKWLGP